MVFVEHTQEEADAVEAIQRHVTEKPQHDLAGVLENSVEDMAQLQSKSPRRHRVLCFARSVSTYWEAFSQQLAHGNVTLGGRCATCCWAEGTMIHKSFEHPIQVGVSFGLVSGVITSLGLVVGLAVGTESRIAVIGGIVTIAIADSLSDALGIHISEEAEDIHSSMEVWVATGVTFMTKFAVASSFLVPVLLLELENAVWVSVAWGIASVAALSWYIARRQMTSRAVVLAEHVGVAVFVVIVSALVGRWVSTTFA